MFFLLHPSDMCGINKQSVGTLKDEKNPSFLSRAPMYTHHDSCPREVVSLFFAAVFLAFNLFL